MRKLAVSRPIFAQIDALKEEEKQAVSVFLNRFRMGGSVTLVPLKGASDYQLALPAKGIGLILKALGNVYLTMWVGDEKDASLWADTHRCEINTRTRSIQIYEVSTRARRKRTRKSLRFSRRSPTNSSSTSGFRKNGSPSCAPSRKNPGLTSIQPQLPERVYEMLTWFLQGEKWEKIVEAYEEDVEDQKAQSRTEAGLLDSGHFRIVESEEELRDIMDKPLAQWRVFLHPSQRQLVDRRWHGAARITGGAGTGKTVVALHRAKRLVELADWSENDRLLFTTFTRNLAVDIEAQLRTIVSREHMKRITVLNIDAWLATFLRQHGCAKSIV